jgi:hypothetical protein
MILPLLEERARVRSSHCFTLSILLRIIAQVAAGRAAIKRRQKLSAPGGISSPRTVTLRNSVLLHGRVLSRSADN